MLQYIHNIQNKVRSEVRRLAGCFVSQTTWEKKNPVSKKKGILKALMALLSKMV